MARLSTKIRGAVEYVVVAPFGLCCVVAMGCAMLICRVGFYPCGTGRIQAEREKARHETMKRRKKNEPVVLPPRRRSLSTSSETKPRWKWQLWKSPAKETKSLLLELPLEIRRKIFAEAIGNSVLHLVQMRKRLGHIRCTISNGNNGPPPTCFSACFSPVNSYSYGKDIDPNQRSDGCLALLQTCRQIYKESIDLLYSTNTFDVNHTQTLLFLARTILPQRLERIRYLQLWCRNWYDILLADYGDHFILVNRRYPDNIGTWEAFWDLVGERMTGLRSVKLGLFVSHDTRDFITEETVELMLQRLREKVRGLEKFELRVAGVDWNASRLEGRMREIVYGERSLLGWS